MMPALDPAFLGAPIAHRALHDVTQGRAENSAEAIEAAVSQGYGVEIDVQLTRDGKAVVFHDEALKRLTGRPGRVRDLTLSQITALPLTGGGRIPSLSECLEIVGGAVALLIEIKDQDGRKGPDIGPLEQATSRNLKGYSGPVAIMSFNPESVRYLAALSPDVARGLTTSSWRLASWPGIPAATRRRLRSIPDLDDLGAAFISHEAGDLDRPRVAEIRAQGLPVLCWTVRSPEEERRARRVAHNITFEGYRPALTGAPPGPPKA